jgi:pyruvate formate lyase activating enzyme
LLVTIFDIKRFAVHDGPGIRTTVFLKGCPLACRWCHNPESQSEEIIHVEEEKKLNGRSVTVERTYGEKIEADELMEVLLRDQHFYEESEGGITFSGGEPLCQTSQLLYLLERASEAGLHTVVDTSGYARPDTIKKVAARTGLVLCDLKNMDSELHLRHTGVDNSLILSNADLLLEEGAKVIFRIPVVPGVNTSKEEKERYLAYLVQRKEKLGEVHLLPYHRMAEYKYHRLGKAYPAMDIPEPDRPLMEEMKKEFETTGLTVHIGG